MGDATRGDGGSSGLEDDLDTAFNSASSLPCGHLDRRGPGSGDDGVAKSARALSSATLSAVGWRSVAWSCWYDMRSPTKLGKNDEDEASPLVWPEDAQSQASAHWYIVATYVGMKHPDVTGCEQHGETIRVNCTCYHGLNTNLLG